MVRHCSRVWGQQTYHLRLAHEETLEFLEGRRLPDDTLGRGDLPREAFRIPAKFSESSIDLGAPRQTYHGICFGGAMRTPSSSTSCKVGT